MATPSARAIEWWLGADGLLHNILGGAATPPAPIPPPTARITVSTTGGLGITLSGGTSTPAAGSTITTWTWTWGDGSSSTGQVASHTYATPGKYLVTLVVADQLGRTGQTAYTATVSVPVNQPPVADFQPYLQDNTDPQNASFAAAPYSGDPDGVIVNFAWTFGDGGAANGVNVTHRYANAGSYQVSLTVTDDGGAKNTKTKTVVIQPKNVPPVAKAAITGTANMSVSVSAAGSSDSDGSIAAYDWDWGDGTGHASSQTATHTYAAVGPWTVTLTVTDDDGATAQATVQAVPYPPAANTPGTYKPTASNTGLLTSKSALTKVTTSSPGVVTGFNSKATFAAFVPASNTTYTNMWFNVPVWGGSAKNVKFKNCFFDGNGIPNYIANSSPDKRSNDTDWACFDASASATNGAANNLDDNFILEDCEINGDGTVNNSVNGVRGCGYTLRRVKIVNVVDGIDLFRLDGGNMHVYLEACYVGSLAYMNTPGDHSDGRTHNDAIQIGVGGAWKAFGCTFEALAWAQAASGANKSPYYPAVTGNGLGLTSNAGPITGMNVDTCWLDGGNHALTAIVGSGNYRTNIGSLTNSKFGRNSKTSPAQISQYMSMTFTGNVYEDNGAAVALLRGES